MGKVYFAQDEGELFCNYFDRLEQYVLQLNYSLDSWELGRLVYCGLNEEYVSRVHILSNGRFFEWSCEDKWELFHYLANLTRKWEFQNSCETQYQESEIMPTHDTPSMNIQEMLQVPLKVQIVENDKYERSKVEEEVVCAFNNSYFEDLIIEEDDMCDLKPSLALPSIETLIHIPCTKVDTSHLGNNSLVHNNFCPELTFKESGSEVFVKNDQGAMIFEVVEIEKKKVEALEDVVCDPPKPIKLVSVGVKEDVKEEMGNEFVEVYPLKEEPPQICFEKPFILVPKEAHDSPHSYLVFTKSIPSFKEPYRDKKPSTKHENLRHFSFGYYFLACACYVGDLCYGHASCLWANAFDKLLRALSCSALGS